MWHFNFDFSKHILILFTQVCYQGHVYITSVFTCICIFSAVQTLAFQLRPALVLVAQNWLPKLCIQDYENFALGTSNLCTPKISAAHCKLSRLALAAI
jgi:hypothetical protein